MSTLLYRLGKFAYDRPWPVIGVWIVLLGVIGGTLAVGMPRLGNEVRIDGTAAQETIDQLAEDLPEAAGGQGQIVFTAPDDDAFTDDTEASRAIAGAVQAIYDRDDVVDPLALVGDEESQQAAREQMEAGARIAEHFEQGGTLEELPPEEQALVGEFMNADQPQMLTVDGQPLLGVEVSEDGSVAMFQFQLTEQVFDLPHGTVDELLDAAKEPADAAGVEVLPGGSLQELPEVVGIGEIVGLGVAAVVLIITLGSLVAAGLPLLNALIGVGTGVGGAFALAHFYELNSMAIVLGLMLGLAVGIDYALFVVNRQRRLIMREGISAREATGRAVGTAGSAVFFAGVTVVIALSALLVIGIGLLSSMAMIAAATVAIAVAVSLTFLPAMLGLVGERIASPSARDAYAERVSAGDDHRTARRWVTFVTRHRLLVSLGVVGLTLVAAIPALDLRLALPAGEVYNEGTDQREAYETVAESLGEGMNGPLLVTVTSQNGDPVPDEAVEPIVGEVLGLDHVAAADAGGFSEDGRVMLVQVIPEGGPTDETTETLVHDLRDLTESLGAEYDAAFGVTGQTAMGIDMSERMSEVMPIYIAIVVVLSLIVLTLVFRSIIVPLKATAGFLLTILATLGATTALFQWGWFNQVFGIDATGPVMAMLPILVTGVAYGLAMDYQVFVVSSMRESWVHGHQGTASVIDGFVHSSRVVVAAAIIMISVFAGFIFNGDPMIKQMGFALAVAIAIDAFLIRMTLVPALMAMFGDRAWRLPGWLDRILPDLDVEGDKLVRQLAAESEHESAETSLPHR